PAGQPPPAPHGAGGGRPRGSRLRPPRRPAVAGGPGAGPPHHPDRRGPTGPADHRCDRGRAGAPPAAARRPPALAVRHPEAMTVRQALRGLTTRGRAFLAAAAAAALCAFALGERDLLQIAVLLAALPLLAAAYVGQTRYRLACTRNVEPRRGPVGSAARVLLPLSHPSRLPTPT